MPTLRDKIYDMECGDELVFTDRSWGTIRVTASGIGKEYGRKYVTSKERRGIVVWRLK